MRSALLIQSHFLDGQSGIVHLPDRIEPFGEHTFLQGLFHFKIMSRHMLTIPPINQDRFLGTQSFGGSCGINGCIASPIHHHPPADFGNSFTLHSPEKSQGIDHPARVPSRNINPLTQMGANGQEYGIESAFFDSRLQIFDFLIQVDRDAHRDNSGNFGVHNIPRQPVLWNPEPHHSPRFRTRFSNGHGMPQTGEMIGSGQSAGSRPDHQHPLAGGHSRFHLPPLSNRMIS